MKTYEECKQFAEEYAKNKGMNINKAYKLKGGYVFDDATEEHAGVLPFFVSEDTGYGYGLWKHLVEHDLTMDDLEEIDF